MVDSTWTANLIFGEAIRHAQHMLFFKDVQDLEDWLEELDYENFWEAMELFDVRLDARDCCDRNIATGEISEESVLFLQKARARLQIIRLQELKYRDIFPDYSLH